MKRHINEQQFIDVCNSSLTMAVAARKLNLHYNTFIRYAKQFGCYRPNPGGKGIKKERKNYSQKTKEILEGKYPDYETFKLKNRLIKEGYKEDKCELCGWSKKRNPNDMFTPCELHHVDGNSHNHLLNNLIILCPNCHSLTHNYRAKNK